MADIGQPGDLSPSPPPADGEPLRAAGVMLMADDGRVLLMRRTGRDHAGEWAFPGGGVEESESPEGCARRETFEETAQRYAGKLSPWTRRIKDGVDFTTFIGESEQFVPRLNEEHDIFTWARPETALATLPLHAGAAVALQRFDMDELGIAKAMVAGDLVSPQRYENLLLVALRITGTGAAYRAGIDEYVWRDPSLYLNDEFLERCQGLTVIWEHPTKRMMNSKEFNRRVIGSVMIPYIKPEEREVWGIAKVYDGEAVDALSTEQWSTSPGVKLKTSISQKLEDGSKLLLEGDIRLLDHIAVCTLGVWDKSGPASGVDVVLDSRTNSLDQIIEKVYAREISSRC
jgi:8-oxo-dGTP pyrophosphatase MutT (NUDIX family)